MLVEWQATRHLAFGGTYSHFLAGPSLDFAHLGNDVDFVGLWVGYSI